MSSVLLCFEGNIIDEHCHLHTEDVNVNTISQLKRMCEARRKTLGTGFEGWSEGRKRGVSGGGRHAKGRWVKRIVGEKSATVTAAY